MNDLGIIQLGEDGNVDAVGSARSTAKSGLIGKPYFLLRWCQAIYHLAAYPPAQQWRPRPYPGNRPPPILLNRENPAAPRPQPIRAHNTGVIKRRSEPAVA